MVVDVRPALLVVLAACASKESAVVTSSSATGQPTASTEPAPSGSASASAPASTAAPPDPSVERAWQKVRAACAGGVFVSQPTFDPQLGGDIGRLAEIERLDALGILARAKNAPLTAW